MYRVIIITLAIALLSPQVASGCQNCYEEVEEKNCQPDDQNITSYIEHMSVHPHLDAFWIFDFQSYYDPNPNQGQVRSYFASNRFNSVKQIFGAALQVLTKSKKIRETQGSATQKAHRSFFNSEMGFFKRWYSELPNEKKSLVKNLLATKYWEVVGGGYVEHDQGCAYYDDIIQNFQAGLHFLKDQFSYYPRAAISADSFGHSQSTLAILAHLGIEGFFVQRSDEHILLQNKTQFVWKAKSANGKYYGALPTHIRWAIHGFQDQFIGGNPQQNFCQTKTPYISNMNRQNQFLKRILKSSHIMRYFGHDFQKFDQYSYSVIQGFMEKFSKQRCKKVNAVYGNPTEYFMIMMGEVFNKVKPLATRQQDIMPIWDYDSGLYWTGYYTTDPYHKKIYRDAGKYLYAARKAFTPSYLLDPKSTDHKQSYNLLQQFSETVSYLQHHDGITGTSKYDVMDKYEKQATNQINKIRKSIFNEMFQLEYPTNTNNKIFDCSLESECEIPKSASGDIYLKVFKTGDHKQPIIVHLQDNQNYQPDCQYEIICMCTGYPCSCDLYLYPNLATYSLIKLKKVSFRPKDAFLLRKIANESEFSYNATHMTISLSQKQYNIGYKRLNGDPTSRSYKHLSRFGDQTPRTFSVRSGKYALGNNLKTQDNLSEIKKVLKLESDLLIKYVILWNRQQMKTVITIKKDQRNQWKIQTHSAAETGKLQDLYLEIVAPHVNNNKKFYTDSNGWLVMKRQLFKHQDYQAHFSPEGYDDVDGNSYPMTAFAYIMNEDGTDKVSVNTQRPQGVISIKPGTLWINYDRLSSDDGKWVYENTYRAEYQKFTHYVTVNNNNNNERTIQKMIDEPLIIQGNSVDSNQRVPADNNAQSQTRKQWEEKVGLNRVKFQIRPWNDSSVLLRVFNMWDEKNASVELFSAADNISTFLTAFYGNQIQFRDVYETNLGGNIKYQDFIKKKWNWNSAVNLDKENQIFNKKFGQNIILRPLEIRTFVFQGVKVKTDECKSIKQFKYKGESHDFTLDTSKQHPTRSKKDKENQIRATDYLLNGNLCSQKSPVSNSNFKFTPDIQQIPDIIAEHHRIPGSKSAQFLEIQASTSQFTSQQQQPYHPSEFKRPQPQPQPQHQPLPTPILNPSPSPKPKPEWIPLKPQIPKAETIKVEGKESSVVIGGNRIVEEKVLKLGILTKEQKQIYFSELVKKIREETSKQRAKAAEV